MECRPINIQKVEEHASNIYEAVIVAAKRARVINDEARLEFNTLLSSMPQGPEDDFEDKENPDQLKFSLEFENRPKPHLQAQSELLEGDIKYSLRGKEAKQ